MKKAALQLKPCRSLWGGLAHPMTGGIHSLPVLSKMIAESGYTGVEVPISIPMDLGKANFLNELKNNNLEFIAQVFTDHAVCPGNMGLKGHTASGHFMPISKHLKIFKEQIDECMNYNALQVTCQLGNDYWTISEADEFFNDSLKWLEQFDMEVMFETHRGRFLYSPWQARDYVHQWNGRLKLAADFSHYTNVAEAHPDFPPLNDVFKKLSPYVHHIHARIGYEEGPQVNDPAAPEWESYVLAFEKIWDNIWRYAEARGDSYVTMTTEFGPSLYQHCLPYTKQPVADWWAVNSYIGDRQIQRFNSGSWRVAPENSEESGKTQTRVNDMMPDYKMEDFENQTSGKREADTRTKLHLFTDEEVAQFHRDGYIIKRNMLDKEESAKLLKIMDHDTNMEVKGYGKGDAEGKKVTITLWNTPGVNMYGAVARSARIVDNFERLFGDEVYHYHSKVIRKEPKVGGSFEWHQDYGYWYDNGILKPDMGTVFMAVDDITKENGCLNVLKGSHLMGRIDHISTGEQAGAC